MHRITHKPVTAQELAAIRVQALARVRIKRTLCTTCDGKVCVGSCRFQKPR